MKDQRILIVGAGPTGLGCAWQLEAEGHTHYSVIEGDSEPGGLASSLQDAHGYTWDLGGHVQFSHYACYDRVLDQVLPDQWLWHDRDASIWTANRWVPYPFQRNLHHLDRPEHERMLAGLTATIPGAGRASANFDQWIRATFGDAITQRFMIPYNQKVWGFPLTDLSASWISDRVALPKDDRADDRAGHLADDTAWGPNQRFRYPASGGTGAIWKAVQAALPPERFSFNRRLQSVDIRQQVVRDDAGQTWPYDALVSTMPIDTLIRRMPDASREAQEAATTLLHSSVHVVGIGLCGGMPDVLRHKRWIYCPDEHSPYYRVTVFSNYAPSHVPPLDGAWSLMMEVCETPRRPVARTSLLDHTVAALRTDGFITPQATIISRWHRRLDYGYPTPTVGRDAALATLQAELESHQVYSRGRFGGWKYEASNQDHAFMQGVELAQRLLNGTSETTYPDPDRANSGVFLKT